MSISSRLPHLLSPFRSNSQQKATPTGNATESLSSSNPSNSQATQPYTQGLVDIIIPPAQSQCAGTISKSILDSSSSPLPISSLFAYPITDTKAITGKQKRVATQVLSSPTTIDQSSSVSLIGATPLPPPSSSSQSSSTSTTVITQYDPHLFSPTAAFAYNFVIESKTSVYNTNTTAANHSTGGFIHADIDYHDDIKMYVSPLLAFNPISSSGAESSAGDLTMHPRHPAAARFPILSGTTEDALNEIATDSSDQSQHSNTQQTPPFTTGTDFINVATTNNTSVTFNYVDSFGDYSDIDYDISIREKRTAHRDAGTNTLALHPGFQRLVTKWSDFITHPNRVIGTWSLPYVFSTSSTHSMKIYSISSSSNPAKFQLVESRGAIARSVGCAPVNELSDELQIQARQHHIESLKRAEIAVAQQQGVVFSQGHFLITQDDNDAARISEIQLQEQQLILQRLQQQLHHLRTTPPKLPRVAISSPRATVLQLPLLATIAQKSQEVLTLFTSRIEPTVNLSSTDFFHQKYPTLSNVFSLLEDLFNTSYTLNVPVECEELQTVHACQATPPALLDALSANPILANTSSLLQQQPIPGAGELSDTSTSSPWTSPNATMSGSRRGYAGYVMDVTYTKSILSSDITAPSYSILHHPLSAGRNMDAFDVIGNTFQHGNNTILRSEQHERLVGTAHSLLVYTVPLSIMIGDTFPLLTALSSTTAALLQQQQMYHPPVEQLFNAQVEIPYEYWIIPSVGGANQPHGGDDDAQGASYCGDESLRQSLLGNSGQNTGMSGADPSQDDIQRQDETSPFYHQNPLFHEISHDTEREIYYNANPLFSSPTSQYSGDMGSGASGSGGVELHHSNALAHAITSYDDAQLYQNYNHDYAFHEIERIVDMIERLIDYLLLFKHRLLKRLEYIHKLQASLLSPFIPICSQYLSRIKEQLARQRTIITQLRKEVLELNDQVEQTKTSVSTAISLSLSAHKMNKLTSTLQSARAKRSATIQRLEAAIMEKTTQQQVHDCLTEMLLELTQKHPSSVSYHRLEHSLRNEATTAAIGRYHSTCLWLKIMLSLVLRLEVTRTHNKMTVIDKTVEVLRLRWQDIISLEW